MDVIHPRCAGLDISKRDAKVCVRVAGTGRGRAAETVTTWSSMTSQILALRDHLASEQVTCVVMEATSDYWKPFYYLLEDLPGAEVILVNARHVKNLPGRKTDVADATWLAQLGAHGLVRASFVPPEPIRRLRDLTRTRTSITRERSREVQRLEKLLEDSGVKLSSVATDIMGVSGRSMIEALIRGDRDVARMADLAQRRMRAKIPRLTEALVGRFTEHHAFLAQLHLNLIDQHTAAINQLTNRIEEVMEPFRGFHDLVRTIPGIGPLTADVIVAETGADMSQFPTGKHLASWAGTTPGNNESAGKVKSSRTRPGNPYLQGALGVAAMSIARAPGTYLNAGTDGSRCAGDPRKPTSRSNTHYSRRSGRWAPPAPRTTTLAPTTTPDDAPSRQSNARSISSKRWATASASTRHPEPTPRDTSNVNLLVSIAALARTVGREDSGWPVAVGWARRGSLMGPSWSTPVTLWCW